MAIKNKDIAKILNISPAAVSLARNNKAGVSEETRLKVNKLVMKSLKKEMSAEVQQYAGEKGNILLSIHKTHGEVIRDTSFFLALIEAIQQETLMKSYNIIMANYDGVSNLEEHIRKCCNEDVKGILLLASEMKEKDLEAYKTCKAPIVLLDSFFPDVKMDVVGINNMDIVRESVRYAYQQGHRKIGCLRSRIYTRNFEERFFSYRLALEELGLEMKEDYIFDVHCTSDLAYIDMKEILKKKRKDMPTVLIAGNDLLAAGAAKALKEFGYKIPKDMSIIGFDDMPISRMMDPPLTSMKIYNWEIAQMAVKRLVERFETNVTSYCKIEVGGEIVIRDSVADLNE